MMYSLQEALNRYRDAECPSLSGGHLFSRFATDMAFSEILSRNKIRISQLWTDGTGDLQQDGLCILIDGKAVVDEEEAKSMIARRDGISCAGKVELFFLQSKSKNSFDLAEFNTFTSGIQNFLLNDKVPAGTNCKIQAWWHVWRLINKELSKTVGQKPEVVINVFIAFSGSDLKNEYIEDQKQVVKKNVALSLRFPVKFVYKTLGEKELCTLYAKRQQSSARKASQPVQAPDGTAQRQSSPVKKRPAPVRWQSSSVHVAVRSVHRQQYQHPDMTRAVRDELRNFVSGRIVSVDTYDCSGIVETKKHGEIAFNFSDLMYPLQEMDLDSGKFARFELELWRGGYKVKGGTLQVF